MREDFRISSSNGRNDGHAADTKEEIMKRKKQRTARLIGGLAVLVALGVLGGSARAQGAGAATYKTKCAVCHGPDGKGDTSIGKTNKIRDLGSADVQKQSDAELTTIIADGKGKMPAYGKSLKADQVKELVAFIRSLKS
jgi:cytochrome c6